MVVTHDLGFLISYTIPGITLSLSFFLYKWIFFLMDLSKTWQLFLLKVLNMEACSYTKISSYFHDILRVTEEPKSNPIEK